MRLFTQRTYLFVCPVSCLYIWCPMFSDQFEVYHDGRQDHRSLSPQLRPFYSWSLPTHPVGIKWCNSLVNTLVYLVSNSLKPVARPPLCLSVLPSVHPSLRPYRPPALVNLSVNLHVKKKFHLKFHVNLQMKITFMWRFMWSFRWTFVSHEGSCEGSSGGSTFFDHFQFCNPKCAATQSVLSISCNPERKRC